jgi:antitoxin CptB
MAESPEVLRKRLLYRSRYRGTREMDMLLGRFAEAHLPGFSAGQVARYARLLELPDNDLFDWISGREAVPGEHDCDVMRLLLDFKLSQSSP